MKWVINAMKLMGVVFPLHFVTPDISLAQVLGGESTSLPPVNMEAAKESLNSDFHKGGSASPSSSAALPISDPADFSSDVATVEELPTSVMLDVIEGVNVNITDASEAEDPARTAARISVEATDEIMKKYESVTIEGAVQVMSATDVIDQALIKKGISLQANVQWDAVSIEIADGDTKRVYLEAPLQSNMGLSVPQIPAGTEMEAEGDIAALLASLDELLEDSAEMEEVLNSPQKSKEGSKDTSDPLSSSAGNTGSENEDGKIDLNPDVKHVEETVPVYTQTTEGCNVEIEQTAQGGTAYETYKNLKDGVAEGGCSRSGKAFEIQRTLQGCRADLDRDNGKALPTYNYYYVRNAENVPIGQPCQRSGEEDFYVIEKEECGHFPNFATLDVYREYKTFYTDFNGIRQPVDTCAPDLAEDPFAKMAWQVGGCQLDHNFQSGVSTQMLKLAYSHKDLEYTAIPCQINEEQSPTHTHETKACAARNVDGYNYLTDKVQILVGQAYQDIRACQINADSAAELTKTTATCESKFAHYPAQRKSWGYSRLIYTRDGDSKYASACDVDQDIVFAHRLTDPVAWANDDDNLRATAHRKLVFDAYGAQIEAEAAKIHEGEPAQPYTLMEVRNEEKTATYTDGSCTKTMQTADYGIYTRPDGTEYRQFQQNGPTISTFACTVTADPYWTLVGASVAREANYYNLTCRVWRGGHSEGDWQESTWAAQSRIRSVGTYQGHRPVSREDGTVFTQVSTRNNSKTFYTHGVETCESLHPYTSYSRLRAQAPATIYNQSEWDAAEGW